ncbi:hypothetical protein ACQHIV_35150 [Kribbella sp. GL6]|uniref:hypothetical protein n=1 Tax=Kribbella sp. GL6 TaxID=3419765 RepID=UPI003CFBCF88
MLTVEQIQQHFIEGLNGAVRRPGMYGGELGLFYKFDEVVYVTETGAGRTWQEALEAAGAWSSIGVAGVVRRLMPGDGAEAMASAYADYAHQQGWLRIDRTLDGRDYADLRGRLAGYCATDHLEADVLGSFGEPSVRIGGSNPRYPSVLGYVAADGPIVWFYLWNGSKPDEPDSWPLYEEPVLLAGRCGLAPFKESFVFTPEGQVWRSQMLGST